MTRVVHFYLMAKSCYCSFETRLSTRRSDAKAKHGRVVRRREKDPDVMLVAEDAAAAASQNVPMRPITRPALHWLISQR